MLVMWVCGFVGMWVCGYVGLWVCGFATTLRNQYSFLHHSATSILINDYCHRHQDNCHHDDSASF